MRADTTLVIAAMQSIITVALDQRSYPIYVGPGLLNQGQLLAQHLPRKKAVIITNDVVAPLYLDQVKSGLLGQNVAVDVVVLPDGEANKNWDALNRIFDALLAFRAERSTTLIALGGGVIGDLAGFAAAVYQRGAPFIQIPTTLLAQVDSSVGGKTAINHPLGKNMIGAFYQPRAVIADTNVFNTLPDRELSAGVAEIIKYGLIGDADFFGWLETHMQELLARDPAALIHAIRISCENKASVVARDEREEGLRALLNFGHTFGHAIEAGMGYGQWLHGEAVAAGMAIAGKVSQEMGLIRDPDVQRLTALLEKARLPTRGPRLGLERYLELMGHDKKVSQGKIRFILLKHIGEAFVTDNVPQEILASVLQGSGVDGV